MKVITLSKRWNILLLGSFFVVISMVRAENTYSPNADQSYPNNVYWGDTHLHTNLSWDAYASIKKLGPDEAYRFAKGQGIALPNGMTAKLKRPLDFLVVADHAANMGLMQGLEREDADLLDSGVGRAWISQLKDITAIADVDMKKSTELALALRKDIALSVDALNKGSYLLSTWEKTAKLADKHNTPSQFTAFIGYEWTPLNYDIHRAVIFKDDSQKALQLMPFTRNDSSDPEMLWAHLERYEALTGGEVFAIPHNGNISQGVMFALEDANGNALSSDYAKARSRWEPLFEVTQNKGDSEVHPKLSLTDEFADYETVVVNLPEPVDSSSDDKNTEAVLRHYDSWIKKNRQQQDKTWRYQYGYARSGLKLGLQEHAKLGVNPFKFGMIGSTDSHTALSGVEEDNFWAQLFYGQNKNRLTEGWYGWGLRKNADIFGFFARAWQKSAAGYAGVWAEENTRESLFAAMKRKEVYASTGPRITVRFFGGWDYQPADAFKPNLAEIGYEKGVPMGGDLSNAPDNKSPNFLIRAVRDPDGANLDRVQVIKGWHDTKGELHEKIYDVALSDSRKPNWRGKIKPVGSTVDIQNASYTNSIGDPELAVVWQDPDFNKHELAFYYVRVLEIPTPRWTAYDVKRFGLKDIPEEVPMVTQERAYTSPIWFAP